MSEPMVVCVDDDVAVAKSLARWMKSQIDGFAGPLAVEHFKGGQSNPTYRVTAGNARYVLRRKPPGKLLPSAHAVDREYRVITALAKTGFPVAKSYALCLDEAVIGDGKPGPVAKQLAALYVAHAAAGGTAQNRRNH